MWITSIVLNLLLFMDHFVYSKGGKAVGSKNLFVLKFHNSQLSAWDF